ncbi:MAG: hypothetical protein CSA49_04740 [Gammaproteobacteria bacterium]|nr:MAG: hypothetical protein CSA49_04740 [Gammaproteobacteria bacterium]
MEKVNDLFKSFRNKEIEYDELFGALTRMLSEDPHLSGEAVAALDKAQQQTPIPVTDFINLRAKLENTAATFHQQDISQTPADTETTMMFSEEDSDVATDSGDPTLVGTITDGDPTETPAATFNTPPVKPADDYTDEATVIMPMPPRQAAAAPVAEAAPNSKEQPEAEELPEPELPQSEPELPQPEPETASTPAFEPAPQLQTEPAAPLVKSTKPPLALIGTGVAVAVVVLLVIVFWPASETPEATVETASISNTETVSEATPATTDTPASPSPWEQTTAETSDNTNGAAFTDTATLPIEDTTTATVDTVEIAAPERLEQDIVAAEPDIENETYLINAIKAAVAGKNLGPAEREGTATFLLVKLIALNPDDSQISDVRAMISKKHLELAKESRSNHQWDEAQLHLDAALKVRLPDSYMPE